MAVNRYLEHNGIRYKYILIAKNPPWRYDSIAIIKELKIRVTGYNKSEYEPKLKKAIDKRLAQTKESN
jgi:arsenate reductase-like glutaredoxin family protein